MNAVAFRGLIGLVWILGCQAIWTSTAYADEIMDPSVIGLELDAPDLRRVVAARPTWERTAPLRPWGRDWQFAAVVYGWLSSVSGDAVVNGESSDISTPGGELTSSLDRNVQVIGEVRWRRLFLNVDLDYTRLLEDSAFRLTTIDSTIEEITITSRLGYRLLGPRWGNCLPCCPPRPWCHPTLDVYLGVRYWSTETTFDITVTPPGGITPPIRRRIVDEDSWIDPVIGARSGIYVLHRIRAFVDVDVGGFGLGESSDLTWQVNGVLSWHPTRRWALFVGYRVIGLDRVRGTGANRSGFDYILHGPMIGAGFTF